MPITCLFGFQQQVSEASKSQEEDLLLLLYCFYLILLTLLDLQQASSQRDTQVLHSPRHVLMILIHRGGGGWAPAAALHDASLSCAAQECASSSL